MRLWRTNLRFRYERDEKEITLELTKEEAYAVAEALQLQPLAHPERRDAGRTLQEFLEDSENTEAVLIKPRTAERSETDE